MVTLTIDFLESYYLVMLVKWPPNMEYLWNLEDYF